METREIKKKLYMSEFIEMYKKKMEGTIFAEPGQEMWIEVYAENAWYKRKTEIENKADAVWYGIRDAKAQAKRDKEALKKGSY